MRYPIYIPSKGRPNSKTARLLDDEGTPFALVVEPQDYSSYVECWGEERVLSLPWDDPGSVVPARNWIKGHAEEGNHFRHWQIDDDITRLLRLHKGERYKCQFGPALTTVEDFIDRYENIALAGVRNQGFGRYAKKPLQINNMVYQIFLMRSDLPYRFRPGQEDTDMSLQVLSGGWCTIVTNIYQFESPATMSNEGGATDVNRADGKLVRARELQRLWPHLVDMERRNGVPQYKMGSRIWSRFTTPLKLKEDIDLSSMCETNEYGMRLRRG